ncbi:GxxExxY protein [Phenylobacterium soli]|uniref:GxxExxY protein n=1 Tax=Phenylobacterium soli TaxID=2170551 RepID=A0A328AAQ0_9CAUL|nr:GxxExxY protein [Phenylobacterium soli]RAK51639.1 GxxExxY protein [Phenylobacterium soli]
MDHGTHGTRGTLVLEDETFAVRGAAFEVYRTLRDGFLEAVYQECLGLELASRSLPFVATPRLRLTYKGQQLTAAYVPDFVCFDRLIVELKAVRAIAPEHRAQVINYLKLTGFSVGLLMNFGAPGGVQIERFAL